MICADAGDYVGKRRKRTVAELVDLKASENIPIVVCSYGGGLRTPYWHKALPSLASATKAPVVICGVSGRSRKYTYTDLNGNAKKMGGGGSGVFWPDQEINQVSFRGICLLDMKSRDMEFLHIPR